MTEKVKIIWIYALTAIFLAVNFYLVLNKDIYWFFLLPLVLLVLYYYFVSLDKIVLFITFLTPFAVNISDLDMGLGVSLPTEPLMFGVLLVFVANLFFENKYDKRISNHPISYIIFTSLLWMAFTTLTSEMPVVSIKYLISRLWFVVPFFYVAGLMFKSKENIKKFLWLYLLALLVVIVYTLIQHAKHGFEEDAGHWVMSPFYNDHTAYGAALAMFIPVAVGLLFYPGNRPRTVVISLIAIGILIVGIIFSYGRAAWISVAVGVAVFFMILLRIRFYWVFLTGITLITLFFVFEHQIMDRLEKNKQDSSQNFIEHIQSISNITSDASNLERINRWQAAIRLFQERPVVGWGPGTYQFVYAPYQRSKEKTIISTNLGDKGNAHSEYLGPMAERGLPGMIIFLVLMTSSITIGLRVYKKGDLEVKILSMITTLGLITYFTHGFLNNFLDTDKLSVPFWGFLAIIVALDLYHTDQKEPEQIQDS